MVISWLDSILFTILIFNCKNIQDAVNRDQPKQLLLIVSIVVMLLIVVNNYCVFSKQ